MNPRLNTFQIETPEGIVFPLLVAGPTTRFVAWMIDFFCIAGLVTALSAVLRGIYLISPDVAQAVQIASYFILWTGYSIATEWFWRGQTLGKRLLGLRVMDAQGLRLQFSQVVIRNLLRFVDNLPLFYLLGGVTCLISRHGQRLGDIAGNTIVIRQEKTREPDLSQIMAGKYNSFRDYPHLAARLRQRATPEEAGIALQALLRRDQLSPDARVDLFADVASYFRDMVKFPAEASEGLTDEQYVRNVADLLFAGEGR